MYDLFSFLFQYLGDVDHCFPKTRPSGGSQKIFGRSVNPSNVRQSPFTMSELGAGDVSKREQLRAKAKYVKLHKNWSGV